MDYCFVIDVVRQIAIKSILFLSSPIACVACERTELLKTAIHEQSLSKLLSIRIIFGTYGMLVIPI